MRRLERVILAILCFFLTTGEVVLKLRHGRKHKVTRPWDIVATNSSKDFRSEYDQMDPPDTGSTPPFTFLTINEVNMDSDHRQPKRYVEIYVQANPARIPGPFDSPLKGWRFLMIKGTTNEIIVSIDLSSHISKRFSPHIVIGDRQVPNVNITFQGDKTESCLMEFPPDLDTSPYAIVLLITMDMVVHDMMTLAKINGKFRPMNINNDETKKHFLIQNTWDLVVVGRRVPTNQCEFFTTLFPQKAFTSYFKYLLRDRDSPTSSISDYSLNHCCIDPIQFSPDCFKLGHPSPGLQNDCTGKRFILELEMNKIQRTRLPSLFVDINSPLCKADFPSVPAYRYAVVHDHDYAAAVARVMKPEDSCPVQDMYVHIDRAPPSFPRRHSNIFDIGDVGDNIPKQYITPYDAAGLNTCKHHFSRPEDITGQTFTSWLAVDPRTCEITCRVCLTYFKQGWGSDHKHRSGLQKSGYLGNSMYANQYAVEDHLIDKIHLEAAHFYEMLHSASSRRSQLEIEILQLKTEFLRFRPTMNEVQLAYVELRARVSFKSHRLFMDAVSQLNVDLGIKHRKAEALSQISSSLSLSFHTKLLKRLVEQDIYFSLICDGTTNRNVPYLVCLLQTLEDSQPIVYFWGLIVITTGESGYNMVEDLKVRVARDDENVAGFKEFFKRRITAFVSDSASNMVGQFHSFYAYLKQYVGRDIALVKCGAHKLQRAILHGINFPTDTPKEGVAEKDRLRYFKSFTKINNQFYSFYMSRGSKRFQEFVELAEELDLRAYRIHYFFDVRWAASHKKCMETLYKNYDALYTDLNRLSANKEIDEVVSTKATELFNHLTDKTFAVVVAEFVDMLSVFKVMSERFQAKGGIMAGNVAIVRDGYEDIKFLKSQPGAYLKHFLNECSCEDVCDEGNCTLEQYDQCNVVYKSSNQILKSREDGKHTIALSLFREQLYDNILQQLLVYFEPDTLEAFEIFNPQNFIGICGTAGASTDVSAFYSEFESIVPNTPRKSVVERLKLICKFYFIQDTNCNVLQLEWKTFLGLITADPAVMKMKDYDPAKFWSGILARTDLQISAAVRDLIRRVMSTSFTSADAERAFSMVSNIKTPDRSNLSPVSLENLVRISFNGPERLAEEKLFEYTKDFVKIASRVDDYSKVGGRPAKSEAFKSFFSKSRIF